MIRPGRMLAMVLSKVFGKPATENYPFVKVAKSKTFRAALEFYPEKCIGCKLCVKDCPANAIEIVKVADKKFDCIVNLSKCIYCGQCVDSCMKKALEITQDFELASLDKKTLTVTHESKRDTEKPA